MGLLGSEIMKRSSVATKYIIGSSEYLSEQVKTITIQNSNDVPTEGVTASWDVSAKGDGSVMAWIEYNSEVEGVQLYDLYLGGSGDILLPQDSSWFFSNYSKCMSIEGMKFLNTANVTNMNYMFLRCRSLTSLDVSGFDTSEDLIQQM